MDNKLNKNAFLKGFNDTCFSKGIHPSIIIKYAEAEVASTIKAPVKGWWWKTPLKWAKNLSANSLTAMFGGAYLGEKASDILRGESGYGYEEHEKLINDLDSNPIPSILGGSAVGALSGKMLGGSTKASLIGAGLGGAIGYLGRKIF